MNFPWSTANRIGYCAVVFLTTFVILSVPNTIIIMVTESPLWMATLTTLVALLPSVVLFFVHRRMQKQIEAMREELDHDAEVDAIAIIAERDQAYVGIAQFRNGQLILIPVGGQPLVIDCSSVASVTEVNRLAGSRLYGASRGFELSLGGDAKVAFAVETPAPWRQRLAAPAASQLQSPA